MALDTHAHTLTTQQVLELPLEHLKLGPACKHCAHQDRGFRDWTRMGSLCKRLHFHHGVSISTLQPEIIAKLIPKTLFHVTEMKSSKKIILKQFFHVILWITNEYVICNFREINSRKLFLVTEMYFFRKLIPKTKNYVCDIFWLECTLHGSMGFSIRPNIVVIGIHSLLRKQAGSGLAVCPSSKDTDSTKTMNTLVHHTAATQIAAIDIADFVVPAVIPALVCQHRNLRLWTSCASPFSLCCHFPSASMASCKKQQQIQADHQGVHADLYTSNIFTLVCQSSGKCQLSVG